jgi:hypothetical protein
LLHLRLLLLLSDGDCEGDRALRHELSLFCGHIIDNHR